VGVRNAKTKKLAACITGVPADIAVYGARVRMCEINFLCIHKKLRSKRLAPVLIKEVTRRVNRTGIFQAAYTAGIVIPKPVTACRYYHRSINPKKLIEVQFSRLAERMTMTRTIRLYQLPDVRAGCRSGGRRQRRCRRGANIAPGAFARPAPRAWGHA
jgi:glycylpeptide N-tetradecanoyltransferase